MKETTGRLEINHLKEFRKDVKNFVKKWERRLKTYDYSWSTLADISNNLIKHKETIEEFDNILKHIETTDGT